MAYQAFKGSSTRPSDSRGNESQRYFKGSKPKSGRPRAAQNSLYKGKFKWLPINSFAGQALVNSPKTFVKEGAMYINVPGEGPKRIAAIKNDHIVILLQIYRKVFAAYIRPERALPAEKNAAKTSIREIVQKAQDVKNTNVPEIVISSLEDLPADVQKRHMLLHNITLITRLGLEPIQQVVDSCEGEEKNYVQKFAGASPTDRKEEILHLKSQLYPKV